jgi:hypothetical protein
MWLIFIIIIFLNGEKVFQNHNFLPFSEKKNFAKNIHTHTPFATL